MREKNCCKCFNAICLGTIQFQRNLLQHNLGFVAISCCIFEKIAKLSKILVFWENILSVSGIISRNFVQIAWIFSIILVLIGEKFGIGNFFLLVTRLVIWNKMCLIPMMLGNKRVLSQKDKSLRVSMQMRMNSTKVAQMVKHCAKVLEFPNIPIPYA